MSFSGAKAYARGLMTDLGYTEWLDGFNFENIPRTLQNRAYHLELGQATIASTHQDNHAGTVPLTVRVLLGGFRNPKSKIEEAAALAETIVDEFVKPSNRLTQTTSGNGKLVNVRFVDKSIVAHGPTNDNLMRAVIVFQCDYVRGMRGSA
jgi:hypothetical protein